MLCTSKHISHQCLLQSQLLVIYVHQQVIQKSAELSCYHDFFKLLYCISATVITGLKAPMPALDKMWLLFFLSLSYADLPMLRNSVSMYELKTLSYFFTLLFIHSLSLSQICMHTGRCISLYAKPIITTYKLIKQI